MLRMNVLRSRVTGCMVQAAPGPRCIAVTLTHRMATAVRRRTRNVFLLLSVLRSVTHTQAASGPPCFFSVCLSFSFPFCFFLPHFFQSLSPSLFLFRSVWYSSFTSFFLSLIYLLFLSLFLLLHSNISSNHPLLFVPFFTFLTL